MDRHIGLIRGVNVGGKNRLAMADLRAFLESLGLSQVETYVQSGNFVFADPRDPAELEPLIEQQAVHHFGRETLYWVLAAKRWRDLIAANPFPDAAASDPARLLVYVAKGELDHERLASAAKKFQTTERFEIVDGRLYAHFPDGAGRSALLGSSAWVRATARTTARNWNTVLALAALAERPR